MMNYNFVFVFAYLMGFLSFIIYNKHLMTMLISLEMMGLCLFFLFIFNLIIYGQEIYISLYFLILVVCEGSLGLGILIYTVRSYGNDYYQALSIGMC